MKITSILQERYKSCQVRVYIISTNTKYLPLKKMINICHFFLSCKKVDFSKKLSILSKTVTFHIIKLIYCSSSLDLYLPRNIKIDPLFNFYRQNLPSNQQCAYKLASKHATRDRTYRMRFLPCANPQTSIASKTWMKKIKLRKEEKKIEGQYLAIRAKNK